MSAVNELKDLSTSLKADLEVHGETLSLLIKISKLLEDFMQHPESFPETKSLQYFSEDFIRDIVLILSKQPAFSSPDVLCWSHFYSTGIISKRYFTRFLNWQSQSSRKIT